MREISKGVKTPFSTTVLEGGRFLDIVSWHFKKYFRFNFAECGTNIRNFLRLRKCAFTLAEVLITLGIIGVVAALTLPTLNKKINEMIIVNKVTKNYATMTNALKMAIAEHGTVDTWGMADDYTEGVQEFMDIYKKYFKITIDCGSQEGCLAKNMYNNGNLMSVKYDDLEYYYKMILSDGGSMWVRTNNSSSCERKDGRVDNVCAIIWYDYNGKKKPNTVGKDIFEYQVLRDNIIPCGVATSCPDSPIACASYILKYKKADYLKNLN